MTALDHDSEQQAPISPNEKIRLQLNKELGETFSQILSEPSVVSKIGAVRTLWQSQETGRTVEHWSAPDPVLLAKAAHGPPWLLVDTHDPLPLYADDHQGLISD